LTLAVLMLVGAGMVALSGPANAQVTAVKGSAYGVYASVSLFGGPANVAAPNPTVTLAPDASNSPQTATAPSGHVKVGPANFCSPQGKQGSPWKNCPKSSRLRHSPYAIMGA